MTISELFKVISETELENILFTINLILMFSLLFAWMGLTAFRSCIRWRETHNKQREDKR